MSLTKTQSELLEAMKRGVKCHYMPCSGLNPHEYYFREDSHKKCTQAAKRLFKLGLVVKCDVKPLGYHTLKWDGPKA